MILSAFRYMRIGVLTAVWFDAIESLKCEGMSGMLYIYIYIYI